MVEKGKGMSVTISKRRFLKGIVVATVACLGGGLATSAPAEDRNYLLATATTGGTYYPVGVALATVTKVKLQPQSHIGISAINSAGSGENVRLLQQNEVQFAILQGLFGYYAWNGEGPVQSMGPQRELRAVTMLWQNVEHFLVKQDYASSGTISDMLGLKGKKVSMGRKNSGTLGSNRLLMQNLGLDIERDFDLVYLGYGPSADALQNGQIEAMSTPAGPPVSAVTRVMAAMGQEAVVLDFTDEQLKKADGGLGLWVRHVIPEGTYPGQTKQIQTIAQANFLAVRADVDEEAVYLITKTIYENLPFLHNIHRATTAMSLESALGGLPMPLHPGALRYFQEQSLEVPENLIVN
jgi:TRAP transporter TAXI family solute receptor